MNRGMLVTSNVDRLPDAQGAESRGTTWRPLAPFSAQDWWLLGLVFLIGAWVRLHDLNYNTVYLDEADNITIARRVLAGELIPNPIGYHLGWYLFPLMAWWADQLGGVEGMRAMTGVLGLVTMGAVAQLTRRFSGNAEAIGAAALMAVLSPFVFAGRMAYRESATICFLSLGVMLFVEASATDRRRLWAASALSVFAALLCKHPLALFGPPLFLLSMLEGPRARRWFGLPLTVLCLTYVYVYRVPLTEMWHYLRTSTAYLNAPSGELLQIYVWRRLDVWVLFALAVSGFCLDTRTLRWPRLAMLGGAILFAAVHVSQRADYNTYRQAVYVLMPLIPIAIPTLGWLIERVRAGAIALPIRAVEFSCLLLAVPLALAGRDWTATKADIPFQWASNAFATDYLRAWASPTRRVLVDDQTLRYSLWPEYRPDQITDPFYISYGGQSGTPAYVAAVREGVFDFLVFTTGMLDAVRPALDAHYRLVATQPDSATNAPVQVYRRIAPAVSPPVAQRGPLVVTQPATNSRVYGMSIPVRGVLTQRRGGEAISVEVFTDKWYPQGTPVGVDPLTGDFEANASLGGRDVQRCHHLIRVRVRDPRGRLLYSTLVPDVARIDPSAVDPACDAG